MATTYEQPSPPRDYAADDALSRVLTRGITVNWEVAAYIVILALALFTRFYMLGDRVMSHDESLHTRYSYNLYAEGNFQHTPLMHGPILFHMTALSYFLFDDNDFTARIYTSALGVLMVMFPLLFRPWLGRIGAVLASVMLLISPITLYYNRYIRHDTPSIFFSLVMVLCTFMYINGPLRVRRKAYWLYIFAAAMLGNLGSKETAFIYIAIFGSFLTLYWVVRLVQHFWRVPGRPLLSFISIGTLVGGVIALGMYIVLSIIRPETLAEDLLARSLFINWTFWIVAGGVGMVLGTAVWAFRGLDKRLRWGDIAILLLIALIALTAFIVLEELSWIRESSAEETAELVEPGDEGEGTTAETINMNVIAAAWVAGAIIIAGVLYSWRAGWWRTLHRFPELDILILMGTLILPWLTPFIIKLTGASAVDYSQEGIIRAVLALVPTMAISITVGLVWNWRRWLIAAAIFYVLFAFFFTTMFTNWFGLATGMIGSLGYWLEQQAVRRGSQPQYYYLLIIMPFYEFLPIVGSVGAMLAGLTVFWRRRRRSLEVELSAKAKRKRDDDALFAADDDEPSLSELVDGEVSPVERQIDATRTRDAVRREEWLTGVPFLLFVSWWGVLNLIGYTLAGEKMPWLAIHMSLPLILLSGWFFGRIFERVDLQLFARRGWLYLLLFPLLTIAVVQVVAPFVFGGTPFGGLQQQQLSELYRWLAMIAVSALVLLFIYQVIERTGWPHMGRMIGVFVFTALSVLTFRSAWMASFVNYDHATEFLVYAHSAPAVKWVLDDLEELSQRVTGGPDLRFAYDNETSWPNSWYYRDFPSAVFVGGNPTPQSLEDAVAVVVGEANRSKVEPILEDRYFAREYIRMWWPMQDYFNLDATRVANTFDFGDNPQAAQIRRGLFDIWWSRDYSTYSEAVNGRWNLTEWPVSDRMHLYVRRDIAAQIWDLGAGELVALGDDPEAEEVNICNANWQLRGANLVFDTRSNPDALLTHPLDLEIGPNGRLAVAEEFGHEITLFDTDGELLDVIGTRDPNTQMTQFNRPNAVAFDSEGNLYIADTWNYRVQVYSPEGELLREWGTAAQFGFEAPEEPVDGLWGPRDIEIDELNNVYVSDTGNKRVRVYTSQGQFIRDIGTGGVLEGQLDEPSGLALHPDGRLFVADTWNQRVSVFDRNGEFRYAFPVRAWYNDLGNRPYLAIDADRDLLYVTDPDAGRVLVYNTAGDCLGSFGQPADTNPNEAQFMTASGIATAPDGTVFISDAGAGRVLRFTPFEAPVNVMAEEPVTEDIIEGETAAEATDLVAEGDAISTQAVTAEVSSADTESSEE